MLEGPPGDRVELGRWDLQAFDPDRHQEPPQDLEREETTPEEDDR